MLAASPGLEPRLTESESAVLPLDDEAIICVVSVLYSFFHHLSNSFLFSKYFVFCFAKRLAKFGTFGHCKIKFYLAAKHANIG